MADSRPGPGQPGSPPQRVRPHEVLRVVQQMRAGTTPVGYPAVGGRYVVDAKEAPSLLQQLFGSGVPVAGCDRVTFSLQVQGHGMSPAIGGSVGFTFTFTF